MKILALVLRGFFAVLLLITAVTKLADFSGFVQIVASFDVLPAPLLVPAAWMLTLLELGLGLWLLSGWLLCGASIGLLALHSGLTCCGCRRRCCAGWKSKTAVVSASIGRVRWAYKLWSRRPCCCCWQSAW